MSHFGHKSKHLGAYSHLEQSLTAPEEDLPTSHATVSSHIDRRDVRVTFPTYPRVTMKQLLLREFDAWVGTMRDSHVLASSMKLTFEKLIFSPMGSGVND